MKKISFLFVLGFLAMSFNSFSQIKVNSSGNVGIKTTSITDALVVKGLVRINAQETSTWGSAIRTRVSNQNACAYHLYNDYYGQDVFYVNGSGYLWCKLGGYFGSDIKMKEDIRDLQSPLSKVLKLKGVMYKYKDDKEKDKSKLDDRIGLIAQDVEQIIPEVVKEMQDGTKAIAYTDLIGVLVEAIKEQQEQIAELQERNSNINKLSKELENMASQIRTIEDNCCNSSNEKSASISDEPNNILNKEAELYQNIPNPFSRQTKITCYIPTNALSSSIHIYDMTGHELEELNINGEGEQSLTVSGSKFKPGMYLYALVIDGKEIDTKRMILTK